jgi:hypothetical protein
MKFEEVEMEKFRLQLLKNLGQENKLQMTEDYYEASKKLDSCRWFLGQQIGAMEKILTNENGVNAKHLEFIAQDIVNSYRVVREDEVEVERLWKQIGLE